jgi:hypothetical protein
MSKSPKQLTAQEASSLLLSAFQFILLALWSASCSSANTSSPQVRRMSKFMVIRWNLVVKMFLKIDPCTDMWYTDGDVLTALVVLLIVGPLAAAKDISFLGYTSGSLYYYGLMKTTFRFCDGLHGLLHRSYRSPVFRNSMPT